MLPALAALPRGQGQDYRDKLQQINRCEQFVATLLSSNFPDNQPRINFSQIKKSRRNFRYLGKTLSSKTDPCIL